ncbi:hypothetical protein QTO34_015295 [Cnephaeus nilssonii]|uniref:Uncharacterized protein n=1 Tax=Cnephaeus nilssonii TaxID=3371016 RepID=A0AA40I4U8_CNENI|nr:hypothetical protein QTO34_015295 [Eptesicus nilssonii]
MRINCRMQSKQNQFGSRFLSSWKDNNLDQRRSLPLGWHYYNKFSHTIQPRLCLIIDSRSDRHPDPSVVGLRGKGPGRSGVRLMEGLGQVLSPQSRPDSAFLSLRPPPGLACLPLGFPGLASPEGQHCCREGTDGGTLGARWQEVVHGAALEILIHPAEPHLQGVCFSKVEGHHPDGPFTHSLGSSRPRTLQPTAKAASTSSTVTAVTAATPAIATALLSTTLSTTSLASASCRVTRAASSITTIITKSTIAIPTATMSTATTAATRATSTTEVSSTTKVVIPTKAHLHDHRRRFQDHFGLFCWMKHEPSLA